MEAPQPTFTKLIFADRSSYDISAALFKKLENLSSGPNGGILYIDRNPELFNKYVLKYIQGYQNNIVIENFIDFSTFLGEMNHYGVKMSMQDLISIQMKMTDFKNNIEIVRKYFGKRINKKTGKFRGPLACQRFKRMRKWRPVFIQIAQFCKKISPTVDLASKILELLFFDDRSDRPLYILNAEITNVVYYVVEKLANKICHSGVGFIDLMTFEDNLNEMITSEEPLKVVQSASKIF